MLLQTGDVVALVAPAANMRSADQHLVDSAMALLFSWGLIPRLLVEDEGHMYLAAPDEVRLAALHKALVDEDVRAIFATRGGYGSQRLLRNLDLTAVTSERFLVGFSDITALMLAATAAGSDALRLVHGPNLATNQLLDQSEVAERNRTDLRAVLFENATIEESADFLVPGAAAGVIRGGCLSLVASQVGTPYLPSFDDAIVFLEDVGERPYAIDRMLHQLLNAGLLSRAAGFVFGTMHNCTDDYNRIEDVITDVLAHLELPIAFGLPSGHGPRNRAIPLDVPAELSSVAGTVKIGADEVSAN